MEAKIKVSFDKIYEFEINPDKEVWNEASFEEREIYVKNALKEYIEDNMDEIIEDVLYDAVVMSFIHNNIC